MYSHVHPATDFDIAGGCGARYSCSMGIGLRSVDNKIPTPAGGNSAMPRLIPTSFRGLLNHGLVTSNYVLMS